MVTEFLDAGELRALTGGEYVWEHERWCLDRAIPSRRKNGELLVRRVLTDKYVAYEMARDLRKYVLTPDIQTYPAGQYPEGEGCGVYMLFDNDGGLNYIGQSLGVGYRVIQHLWAMRRGERQAFTEYGYVEVPPWMLLEVEAAHIHALEPPENKLPRVTWNRHLELMTLVRAAWGEKQ